MRMWICASLAILCLAQPAWAGGNDVQQGHAALVKKDYAAAIACFTRAIAADAE